MHIFNMSVTYLQSAEKIQWKLLRGIDFTKYALSSIIYLMQSSENGQVKNPVKFVKKYFSALNFFMHIYNISVIYMRSTEKRTKGCSI